MAIDGVWIPILAILTVPVMAIGLPLARAWARRMDATPARASVPPEVAARLERMEQAIDSIAIEVERIAEGQRFTTRLLSDGRTASGAPAPSASHGRE